MQIVKIEYGRVDKVNYCVDISLGKEEFPRYICLIHLNLVKWLGSIPNGNRAHDI
jgi:hypothetical protein